MKVHQIKKKMMMLRNQLMMIDPVEMEKDDPNKLIDDG